MQIGGRLAGALSSWKSAWLGVTFWTSIRLVQGLISGPALADEICNGADKRLIAASLPAGTSCTATDAISVGPNVTLGDGTALYAPTVGFTGPVRVPGTLRVAGSNPVQQSVWQRNLVLVEVSALDTQTIQVSWLPVDDGVTPGNQVEYEIHLSQDQHFLPDATTLKHRQKGIRSARIEGLNPGDVYYVKMLASTPGGLSSHSRENRIRMPVAEAVRTSQPVISLADGVLQDSGDDYLVLGAGVDTPGVGDVLADEEAGLLRRVTAVTANPDGSITVGTEAASLNQVFEHLELSGTFTLADVPPASPAARAAYSAGSRVTRSVEPAGGASVHWSSSRLTLSTAQIPVLATLAPASLVQKAQRQLRDGGSGYSEGETRTERGSWLQATAPEAVAITPGNRGDFALKLKVFRDDRTWTGKLVPVTICGVQNLEVQPPAGKSAESLVTLGAFIQEKESVQMSDGSTATRTRAATQYLLITPGSEHISDEPYRVRVTAYLDEVQNRCLDRYSNFRTLLGWKEKMTFEFQLFVVSRPNFPVHEEKRLEFTGGFSVNNRLRFDFDSTLETDVRIDGASLQYARFTARADVGIEQELTVRATGAGVLDVTRSLFQRRFVKVFMAGGVPIVVTGTFSTSVRIEGTVTGAMTATETLHMGFDDLSYGLEYRNGNYVPSSTMRPSYALSLHGDADAEANLKISLLPALTLSVYEMATGKMVLDPYLEATAGIHGQIHKDMTWDASTLDRDYWLTRGDMSGGIDLWLYARLSILDHALLQWPEAADKDDYTSYHPVKLVDKRKILGLPLLDAEILGYGHPGDSRAIRFRGKSRDIPNPFRQRWGLGPEAFITFAQWLTPKVISNEGEGYRVLGQEGVEFDSYWVVFDRPGSYRVRMGGYSSLGGWARQVADDIVIELTDSDHDGMIDQWEKHYGIEDPAGDADGDGLTNLEEFRQGRHPGVSDSGQPPVATHEWAASDWYPCQGSCGAGAGTQYRDVWCERLPAGIVVLDANCDITAQPAVERSCTVQPPACPAEAVSLLNDTGITFGGDYPEGNNATCTSNIAAPQDCHQGRDATANDDSDGHAGFSYTKLDANGNELPASATQWSCVKDNVTGLIWEVKTDDGGIHDKDNTYRWGGVTAQGSGYGTYYDDWNELVNGTNAERLCGYGDWRVPTMAELESLVNYGAYRLNINAAYFPDTHRTSWFYSSFWSSSPIASSFSQARAVFFVGGEDVVFDRNDRLRVRLVRSGR